MEVNPRIKSHAYGFTDQWQSDSLITEYDLLCDRQFLVHNINSVGLAGFFVGAMSFGYFSDRFGRRKTFLVGTFLTCVTGVATAFLSKMGIVYFMFGRFLFLLFIHGATIVTFVYGAELLHPHWRTSGGILGMLGFQVGYIALSGLGYAVKGWFHQFLIIFIAPGLMFVSLLFYPESFRWYFSVGRIEEGIQSLKNFA